MTFAGTIFCIAILVAIGLGGRWLFKLGHRLAIEERPTQPYREMLHQDAVYLAGGVNAGTRDIQDQWDRTVKSQNLHSLSRAYAGLQEQFRGAVDSKNQSLANICYVNAVGLIAGAAISGGLHQRKIREITASINRMVGTYHNAFGELPVTPLNADIAALRDFQ